MDHFHLLFARDPRLGKATPEILIRLPFDIDM